MPGIYLAVLANIGFIAFIVLLLTLLKKVTISPRWLCISLVIFICYCFALFNGKAIIPLDLLFSDLRWNWSGKIAAIILWGGVLLALIRFKKDFKIKEAGFTFKQNEGSIEPAFMMMGLFIILQVVITLILGSDPNYDLETLLYQAVIPGFDEEPMFRGVLLFCFSLAVISTRFNLLGAPINVAGLLLVLLFGLAHGVMYSEGEWFFSTFRIALTSTYGFILLWLRERTGSLVFPILAHNSVNLVGQLV